MFALIRKTLKAIVIVNRGVMFFSGILIAVMVYVWIFNNAGIVEYHFRSFARPDSPYGNPIQSGHFFFSTQQPSHLILLIMVFLITYFINFIVNKITTKPTTLTTNNGTTDLQSSITLPSLKASAGFVILVLSVIIIISVLIYMFLFPEAFAAAISFIAIVMMFMAIALVSLVFGVEDSIKMFRTVLKRNRDDKVK